MSTAPKLIAPAYGQYVTSSQHAGLFEVVFVNAVMQTVDIRLVDGIGHVVPNVPWAVLISLAGK